MAKLGPQQPPIERALETLSKYMSSQSVNVIELHEAIQVVLKDYYGDIDPPCKACGKQPCDGSTTDCPDY